MSMNIHDVLKATDWSLLQEQKHEILNLIKNGNDDWQYIPDYEFLEGLVNFIDQLQDAVVSDGIATEAEVFGEIK